MTESPLASNQVVKTFHDFDAFWSEKEEHLLCLHVFGEDYYISANPPADIVLSMLRMQAEGITTVPDAQVLHMTTSIFGEDHLQAWCAKGLTIDKMGDLLSWALDQYQAQKPQPSTAGDQKKVARGKPK